MFFNNRKLFMVIPMFNENVHDWLKMLFTNPPESGHIYVCIDKIWPYDSKQCHRKKCTEPWFSIMHYLAAR